MSNSKTRPSAIDRRRFLQQTWHGVGASLSLALVSGHSLFSAQRFRDNPFTLGVASGDPAPGGAVLWTRLAPDPTDPASLGQQAIPVRWRVATDESMRHLVASGTAIAPAELSHSVHVEVNGLQPGRDYFYQFDLASEESAIGHFRTAPAERDRIQTLRFAFVTCQDWPSGYYVAYRDMAENDLDLVLHLGDYTYEYGIQASNRRGGVPRAFREPCLDLRTYRLRHTLYKLDPDLQAAHAKFPFLVIWDDHEVANDYSGLAPEFDSPSPEFAARRAAAYQAYYEHMPIRLTVAQFPSAGLQIYRGIRYGTLAEFSMLDDRQYRSDNPCGDGEALRCDEALRDNYTMLGEEQERWLSRRFARSSARWNIVGQQLLIAELEHTLPGYPDEWYWNDAWDGYPQARARLLSEVVKTKVENPVFLTGDWHSTFVNDLKLDFKDASSPTIATEFVTPAITTGGDATPYGPYYAPMIPFNPHIKYYEGDQRGYFMATVTPERMSLDLRFMTSVEDPRGVGYTAGSWVVEDGQPGAQPA
ncbi:MAG TPA: alkaline phosphatase D family protein [Vicinamibacterales bacterium]|nr:alkaline phosphatase D family protein [Vicinamibacterales bacterium]